MDAVRVLIFVDVNVLEALLPTVADRGRFAQEFYGTEEEIVEIERATLREEFFVGFENIGDLRTVWTKGFGTDVRGGFSVIFGVADLAEDIPRRESLVTDVEARHREFDGGELVVVIENREVIRQTGRGGFAAKKASAQRMECGEPRAFGRNTGTEKQIRDTRLHFFGGLIGEGDSEDVFSRNAFRNEIGHAKSDGPRFAGAGTSKNEERAFRCFCGETLFCIQLIEEREHCIRSGNFGNAIMLAEG